MSGTENSQDGDSNATPNTEPEDSIQTTDFVGDTAQFSEDPPRTTDFVGHTLQESQDPPATKESREE